MFNGGLFILQFNGLLTIFKVLDQGSDEFAMVKRYLENTHASTHEIQLEIVNVWELGNTTQSQYTHCILTGAQS